MKLIIVVGTRPEAIKMAPVVRRLREEPGCEVVLCATAQHREMLDQVLSLFALEPDIDLDLMRPDQTINELAGRVFSSLDGVLASEKPDWLLVQGDTTTAMVSALAAFHRLCETEGIVPALESSHALARALDLDAELIVVCLSGRGDKDLAEILGREST